MKFRLTSPVMLVTWNVTTASTAMARSESNKGKRGFPGGGATAGEGALSAPGSVEAATATQSSKNVITRSMSASANDWFQSRLHCTALPLTLRSWSLVPAAARRSASAMPSIVAGDASGLVEMAAIAAGVLFSKLLVTVSIPADAISMGQRLGWGGYISASPTSHWVRN